MVAVDRIAEYVELTRRKRTLDTELTQVKEKLAAMESHLAEQFAADGIQSIKASDGSTVYLHRQVWASLQSNEHGEAFEALHREGFGWLVKPGVNTQTLSAEVREWPRDEEGQVILPEGLKPYLKVSEQHKVNVRLK